MQNRENNNETQGGSSAADGGVKSSSVGGGGTGAAGSLGAAASPLAVLGDFELRREIGRGGMGTVYEAFQRSLCRVVALKVLDRQVSASKSAVDRFLREAQAAAKLHHPHIVPIYAQGSENGVYYYAMELVDGPSVAHLIARTRECQGIDTRVFEMSESESNAEARAGRSGVTGTDPSAETVVFRRDDSGVFLKTDSKPLAQETKGSCAARLSMDHFSMVAEHVAHVADALEYAHHIGVVHRDIKPHNLLMGSDDRLRISDFGLARLSEQPGVTMTGEVVGSPLYMSPEQIMGASGDVDHRTDIYSLGATLYEWLVLTPPYPADTRERVIGKIMSSDAPTLRAHVAEVPVDLETICSKALERDRRRRYATAGELRDDLRRFLTNRPIKAKRAGLAHRLVKSVGRHQVATLSAIAAIVALMLSLALYRKQGEIRSTTEAVEEATAAVEQARIEREELLEILGTTMPLELSALLRGAEAVKGMVDPRQRAPGVGPIEGAASGPNESAAVGTPGAIAKRALREFYSAVTPPDWPESEVAKDPTAKALREAERYWRDGNLQGALDLADVYLATHPNNVPARRMHAALSAELGQYEEMAADAAIMVRMDSQSAEANIWRGTAYLLWDRMDQAEIYLGWAAQHDPKSPWARVLHGLSLITLGRAFGALDAFDVATREAPHLVLAVLGRASAHLADGSFQKAVADCDWVLARDPQSVDALTIRGDAYFSMEDFDAAMSDYQAAMSISGKPAALRARYLLAVVQQQQSAKGKKGEAAKGTEAESSGAQSDDGAEAVPLLDWLTRWMRPRSNTKESGKAAPGARLGLPSGRF